MASSSLRPIASWRLARGDLYLSSVYHLCTGVGRSDEPDEQFWRGCPSGSCREASLLCNLSIACLMQMQGRCLYIQLILWTLMDAQNSHCKGTVVRASSEASCTMTNIHATVCMTGWHHSAHSEHSTKTWILRACAMRLIAGGCAWQPCTTRLSPQATGDRRLPVLASILCIDTSSLLHCIEYLACSLLQALCTPTQLQDDRGLLYLIAM